jgi:betaine-aldehyde dehydrogenase
MQVISESKGLLIGGDWVKSDSQKQYKVINPANGELLAEVSAAGPADLEKAVSAAEAASKAWRRIDPQERSRLLNKLASLIESKESEIARADSLNAGHPIRAMRSDVRIGVQDILYYGGLYPLLAGETIPGIPDKVFNYTIREPFGIVGRIVPFNHPFMFACQAIAAPLTAGNSVILKPASITPLSAIILGELTCKVLPTGVVNILTGAGSEVGAAIAKHPKIRRIALTGGLDTGKEIARLGAEHLKYITLELGGKNPMVVLEDADLNKAAQGALKGMNFTWTAGQSCQSTSRCFVPRSLHDEFVTKLARSMEAIKLGVPTVEETEMGSLSSPAQLSKATNYVKIAKSEGAKIVTGGKTPDRQELRAGNFLEPTLLDAVKPDSTVAQEEIFGPVLSIIEWENYEEMVASVNSTKYGLTASIFTESFSKAHRLADEIESGYIWINGPNTTRGVPFGGYRMSGIGRQGGVDELLSYTQTKSVQVTL